MIYLCLKPHLTDLNPALFSMQYTISQVLKNNYKFGNAPTQSKLSAPMGSSEISS